MYYSNLCQIKKKYTPSFSQLHAPELENKNRALYPSWPKKLHQSSLKHKPILKPNSHLKREHRQQNKQQHL